MMDIILGSILIYWGLILLGWELRELGQKLDRIIDK